MSDNIVDQVTETVCQLLPSPMVLFELKRARGIVERLLLVTVVEPSEPTTYWVLAEWVLWPILPSLRLQYPTMTELSEKLVVLLGAQLRTVSRIVGKNRWRHEFSSLSSSPPFASVQRFGSEGRYRYLLSSGRAAAWEVRLLAPVDGNYSQ